MSFKNLQGQKFGSLTVIKQVARERGSKDKEARWLCQCDCGNDKILRASSLKAKKISCGCGYNSRVADLTGQKFGLLTVIKQSRERAKRVVKWECRCDCGAIKIVRSDSLKNGYTQSCGCLRHIPFKERVRTHVKNRVETKEYKMFTSAKHRAKKAAIPFTITLKDIVIPEICPVLNIPIFTKEGEHCPNAPSLDRFIPELGYVPENITVISYKANTIKNNATKEEVKAVLKWMEDKA